MFYLGAVLGVVAGGFLGYKFGQAVVSVVVKADEDAHAVLNWFEKVVKAVKGK